MPRVNNQVTPPPQQTFNNATIAKLTLGAIAVTAIETQVDACLRGAAPIQQNYTRTKMIRAGIYAAANITPIVVAKTTDNALATIFSFVLSKTVATFISSQTRDYEDAKEFKTMSSAHRRLPVEKLIEIHGTDNLVRFPNLLLEHFTLHELMDSGKFPLTADGFLHNAFIHHARLRTLKGISPSDISYYKQILPEKTHSNLSKIRSKYDRAQSIFQSLEEKYCDRTENLQKELSCRRSRLSRDAESSIKSSEEWILLDKEKEHVLKTTQSLTQTHGLHAIQLKKTMLVQQEQKRLIAQLLAEYEKANAEKGIEQQENYARELASYNKKIAALEIEFEKTLKDPNYEVSDTAGE